MAENNDKKENFLQAASHVGEDDVYENANKSLGKKFIILLPILFMVFFQSAFNQFGSILNTISEVFPDAPTTLVQLVVTFPSTCSIPVCLCSGLLATIWPKKKIALAALVSLLIGGCIPLFFHDNIIYLFIASAFIGIGQGAIISTSIALISELFNKNDRDFASGLKTFAGSVGSTFVALMVGILAQHAWYLSYGVYLLTIVIIILVAVLLPMGKPDVKLVSRDTGAEGLAFLKNPHYIYMLIMYILCGLGFFAFYTNASSHVAANGGDVALTSYIFAYSTITAMIAGVIFGFIAKIFKKYVFGFAFAMMAISFAIFATGTTILQISIGSAIFGFSYIWMQAGSMVMLTSTLPKKNMGMGVAIATTMTNVGITLCPIVFNAISGGNTTTNMYLAIVLWAVMCVIEVLRQALFCRNNVVGVSARTDR